MIMANLNKLKETKLKEYYINNKKKNKNGIKNKNCNYYIKNHIYTNIKNMPNTSNHRSTKKIFFFIQIPNVLFNFGYKNIPISQ